MAEIIVSEVVGVLIGKLISGDLMKLARSEEIDSQLNKWKKTLPMIQAVLADASQKRITQKPVELWLHDLQDLAYDIDDILDDLATETLKRKLNQESHGSTSSSKLLKIIPTCCTNFTPHNIMYGRQMSSKLDEITTKLNELVEQKNYLGLDVVNVKVGKLDRVRLEETSLLQFEESKVLGREGDKEALLEKLLGDQRDECKQNVSVVSIVGMGGIGKTTLAKLLYNDDKVKDHFELRAWVCVSDDFDVFNISKAIYQAVTGKNEEFANLDLLHVALKEKLLKKRFLVVLDDVWNEARMPWDLLQSPFLVSAPGSKIIVTTRKDKVASVMNSSQSHVLKILPPETSLSLFAQYALDEQNFDKYSSLEPTAEGIIKKCNGLPLALIALGRVLKTKGRSDDEWKEILNSEIWNLEDGSGILPALKLSYYDLPTHLKQLFAYCSLFPKDYWFDKNELVLLWMAEGFLSQLRGNKSMESLGHQCFEELKSRSFFQHSTNYESRYVMHDLMHDLAISVAGEFLFMLDDKTDVRVSVEAFKKVRHFLFICHRHAVYKTFKEIYRARCLRTFLPVSSFSWQHFDNLDNVLVKLPPRLRFLRVLSLANYAITKVPQSIGSLKHLRYLNFSETEIERLPEEVSDLYNLQSLLVRGCYELTSLPMSFVKLINLRHLDISGTPLLKKMPKGIGGLTSLRTLSKVCIEATNGFKLSELKELSDLEGWFSIEGLDKVVDPIQARDANLEQKKGLNVLNMEWSNSFDGSRSPATEYKVLEWLRPPTKLTTLRIDNYGGIKFPSWVGDSSFDCLTELTLRGCRNCTHLPRLGHLNSLQTLSIGNMDEVNIVDFDGIAFLSLKDLNIECCSVVVLRAIVSMSSSILNLDLCNIKGLTQLPGDLLSHLGETENLEVEDCDELRYLWESESEACKSLVRLQKLIVKQCKKLVTLAEKKVNVGTSNMESLREVYLNGCKTLESYNCPNSVERLAISSCSSVTSLTFSTLHSLTSSLNIPNKDFCFLPQFCLKFLQIFGCKNLKSLSHEHLQRLTLLEELHVTHCENMDYSFPCGSWPPNLKSLTIGRLNKPMTEWGLQNYPTSLVSLVLHGRHSGVVSFVVEEEGRNTITSTSTSFLLPPSLTSLTIHDFEHVESLSEVLQHLTCLKQLHINSCWNLRDLPETTSS